MASLRIAIWNANGVSQRKLELTQFLYEKHIDVMLISETHLTNRNNFKTNGYLFYGTNHPDGKAYGGTGILVRSSMLHHYHNGFSINLEMEGNYHLTLAAVYCPPRFKIREDQFLTFFKSLGDHFLAGGDYNAKHTYWGSRLVNPKGKQLYNTIMKAANKLDHVSPGSPTYWPTDLNKLPDMINFAITKNIPRSLLSADCLPELSSDHSPVFIHVFRLAETVEKTDRLTSHKTNWLKYRKYISSHIILSPQLNSESDIDKSTSTLESILVAAAQSSTPQTYTKDPYPKRTNKQIQQLVHEKRRLVREWQSYRSPSAKQKLKDATKKLTKALKQEEEHAKRRYIEKLSTTFTMENSPNSLSTDRHRIANKKFQRRLGSH